MAARISKDRLLRVCDECGGVDDHPRLVIAGTDALDSPRPSEDVINAVLESAPVEERGRLLADLMDRESVTLHHDCAALSGRGGDVSAQIAAAADGKTGKAVFALVTGANDPVEYRDDVVRGE